MGLQPSHRRSGVKKAFLVVLVLSLAAVAAGLYAHPRLLLDTQKLSYEEKTERLFDKVTLEVSRLRGYPPPEDVTIKVVSMEYFKSETRERLEEAPLLKAREALYRGLLLVPKDFSLLEKKVSQAGMTLAATSETTLYVVREYFDPDERQALRTLAHEFTHMLQHFHLKRPSIRTMDEDMAWTAFIEGEADLVADLYMAEVTGEEPAIRLPPPPASKPEGADPGWALDQIFRFPYDYGENFVYRLFRKHGWEELDRAYEAPPSSSAHILYPERYLSGFTPISLPNPEPSRDGWAVYYPETLGEFFLRVLLLEELPPGLAVEASSGWVGDNSTLYLDHGAHLFYWTIALKDEESATLLKEALLVLFQRMGGVQRDGVYWDFDGRLLAIRRDGPKVALIGSSDEQILKEEAKVSGEDLGQQAATPKPKPGI